VVPLIVAPPLDHEPSLTVKVEQTLAFPEIESPPFEIGAVEAL
jgi:hypothetical protein